MRTTDLNQQLNSNYTSTRHIRVISNVKYVKNNLSKTNVHILIRLRLNKSDTISTKRFQRVYRESKLANKQYASGLNRTEEVSQTKRSGLIKK